MGLIVGDVILECPVEVVDYLSHDLTWPIGTHGVKVREKIPKLIVVHITGAEHGSRHVYRTLCNRGLSIHFVIGRGGEIWQFLDPGTRSAAHTGHQNAQSIGIELVNAGWPVLSNPYGRPLSRHWVHLAKGDQYVRSVERPCLGCLSGQLHSLNVLVSLLCSYLGIPYRRADKRPYVPQAERDALTGIAGHGQLAIKKGDPSADCLDCFPEAV